MKENTSLNSLRSDIDKIDDQLIELLKHRLDIVEEIGDVKKNSGIPIVNKDRENDIVDKIILHHNEKNKADSIKEVFKKIFEVSRDIEKNK